MRRHRECKNSSAPGGGLYPDYGYLKGLKLLLIAVAAAAISPSCGVAQEADAAALAQAAQNPLASVISVPLQWNSNFGMGLEDRTQNVILLLPVFPFSLGEKLTLITRHILPFINQPAITGDGPAFGPIPMPPGRPPEEFDRATGLGDYSGTFWLSPAGSGNLTWGLGATLLIPTATKPAFGADKWGAGPSGVVVWMPGSWVTALIISNTWSFAGNEERADVNQLYAQLVANLNIGKGWYLTSAPVITANWEAESEDRWTVPIGGGAGRIFKIGSLPNDVRIQAFGYLAKPKNGPSWTLQVQWKLMFAK